MDKVRSNAMAQLVEALRYKQKGRGFDFRLGHRGFFMDLILPAALCPGVDSASNICGYQKYFLGGKSGRCVGMTTLPPSCADCLEIWTPQPPRTLWASNMRVQGLQYTSTLSSHNILINYIRTYRQFFCPLVSYSS